MMIPNKFLGALAPELRLMLACATQDVVRSKAEEIEAFLAQSLDWELFLRCAIQHRVYPLVYKTLSNIPNPLIPATILAALRGKYRENALQALRMAGETARVVGSLKENDVRTVVIKGLPLAQLLYGDVTLRPSHDVDLLVWPDNLAVAGLILEKQGYRRIYPKMPLTSRLMRFLIKKDHHFSYCHEQTGLLLELHWRLDHCGVELPLPEQKNLTTVKLAGKEMPVLAAEEEFLSLVLHGAGHSWFRLRWLCDIGKFLEQELNWEKLIGLATQFGVITHLNQALLLADQLLTAPLPNDYRLTLVTDRRAWRLALQVVPFLQKADYNPDDLNRRRDWRLFALRKKYDYQIRVGWKSRFGYVWNHFKPPEADLQLVSLPDIFYPLYYLIRPFTWLGRHVFKKFKS
jgi:hypothetical protein